MKGPSRAASRLPWNSAAWRASQRKRRSTVRRATPRTRAVWRSATQASIRRRNAALRCGFFWLRSARNDWREKRRRQIRQRKRCTGCARQRGWYRPSRWKNGAAGSSGVEQTGYGQRGGTNIEASVDADEDFYRKDRATAESIGLASQQAGKSAPPPERRRGAESGLGPSANKSRASLRGRPGGGADLPACWLAKPM